MREVGSLCRLKGDNDNPVMVVERVAHTMSGERVYVRYFFEGICYEVNFLDAMLEDAAPRRWSKDDH